MFELEKVLDIEELRLKNINAKQKEQQTQVKEEPEEYPIIR